jgi:NTP pyrophosphatase (non-canonical NTP hydrolase)
MRVNLPEVGELVKALRKESDSLADLANDVIGEVTQLALRRVAERLLSYSNRLDRAVTT